LNWASHRIAVVAMLDSEEEDKIPLILEGIRVAGHEPLLVDAELFTHGGAHISRTVMGRYVLRTHFRGLLPAIDTAASIFLAVASTGLE
jgi:hypothetical protein